MSVLALPELADRVTPPVTPAQLVAAFHFRHATKRFDPARRIPSAEFDTVLEAARLSPSSFGQEPWRFVVVQDPALRERLKAHAWGAQGQLPTASHVVLILARTAADMRFDSAYIDHHLREVEQLPPDVVERKRGVLASFQAKDFKLLDDDRAMWDRSAKQCYIALANMMTTAALLGIDSCPMEGFDVEAVNALLATELGIDTQRARLAVMVAFGYRAAEPGPKRRQSRDALVQWA